MRRFNPRAGRLPRIWLLSDARNDPALERIMRAHGAELGLVLRHYHLDEAARRARCRQLLALARSRGQCLVVAGTQGLARRLGGAGCYGAPGTLGAMRAGMLRIATVHDLAEISRANRLKPAAMMLSPVFATNSHPGAAALGALRFRLLARHARSPVVALGGMNARRAVRLGWPLWAALDGLAG